MNEEQKALGQKILDKVEARPELLYMATWETEGAELYDWRAEDYVEGCGTTRCIAGWAIHLADDAPGTVQRSRNRLANRLGLPQSYEAVATALLGLTGDEADDLFFNLDEAEAVAFLKAKIAEG